MAKQKTGAGELPEGETAADVTTTGSEPAGKVVHETTVRGKPVRVVQDDAGRVWLCGAGRAPSRVSSLEVIRAVLDGEPR